LGVIKVTVFFGSLSHVAMAYGVGIGGGRGREVAEKSVSGRLRVHHLIIGLFICEAE
jgi:hypothetical protein